VALIHIEGGSTDLMLPADLQCNFKVLEAVSNPTAGAQSPILL
jgi:hypothetical protein